MSLLHNSCILYKYNLNELIRVNDEYEMSSFLPLRSAYTGASSQVKFVTAKRLRPQQPVFMALGTSEEKIVRSC